MTEVINITDRERAKDALIRTLESARDEMSKRIPQWLPIETAPRHGEAVLTYSRHEGIRMNYVVQCGEFDGCWARSPLGLFPTHWMPLPAAPQDKP